MVQLQLVMSPSGGARKSSREGHRLRIELGSVRFDSIGFKFRFLYIYNLYLAEYYGIETKKEYYLLVKNK